MYLSVQQVASNLGVSTTRVRKLLSQGRIKGAFKVGNIWVIPTVEGKPQATRGKRGPELTWSKCRPNPVTIVHVNQEAIRANNKKKAKKDEREPVISVKTYNNDDYTDEIIIYGSCRVIYRPDKCLKCGAKVWIETYGKVDYISKKSPRTGKKKAQAVA